MRWVALFGVQEEAGSEAVCYQARRPTAMERHHRGIPDRCQFLKDKGSQVFLGPDLLQALAQSLAQLAAAAE
jgi:hypothetical protein